MIFLLARCRIQCDGGQISVVKRAPRGIAFFGFACGLVARKISFGKIKGAHGALTNALRSFGIVRLQQARQTRADSGVVPTAVVIATQHKRGHTLQPRNFARQRIAIASFNAIANAAISLLQTLKRAKFPDRFTQTSGTFGAKPGVGGRFNFSAPKYLGNISNSSSDAILTFMCVTRRGFQSPAS